MIVVMAYGWLLDCIVVQEIGELYEQEQNMEKAITYLERAADYYEHQDSSSSANQCKQKVAQFSAQLEQ